MTHCDAAPIITNAIHPETTHHHLKCFVEFFQPVVDGRKKSEVRKNDRDYQVGDVVTLHEGYHENGWYVYTGRTVSAEISYINDFGLQDGYVNLSLSRVGMLIIS